jgi:hypothetical protein
MRCPYCGGIMRENQTVTCGDSYCSEAGYHERMSQAGPKRKRAGHVADYKATMAKIEERLIREKQQGV